MCRKLLCIKGLWRKRPERKLEVFGGPVGGGTDDHDGWGYTDRTR